MIPLILGAITKQVLRKGLSRTVAKQALQSILTSQKSALLNKVKTPWIEGMIQKAKIDRFRASGKKGLWEGYQFEKPSLVKKDGGKFRERLRLARQNNPTLRARMKKITWRALKDGFKTLGWKAIKEQIWFARNQAKLFSTKANLAGMVEPYASARKSEKVLLGKIRKKEGSITSRAVFSSSWCHSGVWVSSASKKVSAGILYLTVKQEDKQGRVKIGQTYTYYGVSLMVGCLMKQALGRDGTGAGSVFGKTYLRGFRYSKEVPAFQGSEQVRI